MKMCYILAKTHPVYIVHNQTLLKKMLALTHILCKFTVKMPKQTA